MDEPRWDPGLQVERTALAWLRTCLAFLAGALVLVRFAAHRSVVFAAVVSVVTVPLASFAVVVAWRRFRRSDGSLRSGRPLPDGVLPALMAVWAVAVGALCVADLALG